MKLKEKRMSSYPLFVKDPYFSLWMPDDIPTNCDTVFWHGEDKPIRGTLNVDGVDYRFLGKGDAEALTLVETSVNSFETIYRFQKDDFVLETRYLSPLPPNDIDLLSNPVTYFSYSFSSKNSHKVKVRLAVSEKVCYDTSMSGQLREVRINKIDMGGFATINVGLLRQMPLSNSMDECGADWGYYYLAAQNVGSFETADGKYIFAEDEFHGSSSGKILLAFDDVVSIYYFGQWLKGYYFQKGNTIFDALKAGYENYESVCKQCQKFDEQLAETAKDFGEDYLFVLYCSLRQSVAAHKLVADKDRILFLSKECNSDGCIATVDVSYPSIPLYLLFNPVLVKGMLYPILDYSQMPAWKEDFAPHDVGIYPYCVGQYYAVKGKNDEQISDLAVHDWKKLESIPFYYQLPATCDIYDIKRQMPVEESGNMLIIACLYAMQTNDVEFLQQYKSLFAKWVGYLVKFGLIPSEQLCTDDFAGHVDKNANLAVKAILGIKAYSQICALLGETEESNKYMQICKDYAQKWCEIYNDGDHTVLTFGNKDSFSIKYNMAVDALMGDEVFPQWIKRRELDYYRKISTRYGVALDNRNNFAKTDWLLWAASTGNQDDCKFFAKLIVNFINETPQRHPFPDWYNVEDASCYCFRNRSVQGGTFMPLLAKLWKKL